MALARGFSRFCGAVIGLILMGGAGYAVFFVDWRTEVPPEPPIIRPLKTVLIGAPHAAAGHKYPGRVQPNQQVDLAFQVAGPLIAYPVRNGQEVIEGELIARIDPRDFENDLAAARAEFAEGKALFQRMERLYQDGNASQVEYEREKRNFEVKEAAAKQAEKNLEDTYLRAPFAGRIANTLVENYQNVQAKQAIVSLQDISSVEIEVNVPEQRIAVGKEDRDAYRFVATFDYVPGREFEVTLQEFATEADPATQTYAVTFAMPSPEDLNIFPGMTATVEGYELSPPEGQGTAFAVPIDSVPVDGRGQHYVWVVHPADDRTAAVRRVDVRVGELVQDDILVLDGLEQGQRIAGAGVHLLQEGQRVRPFSAEGDEG
ncbi:MAG: efflux RND transporter periplasmic adaptor subunit [bacterium]|nr:efflux RND transporter periplasmic adaptor subunit [bacterium]